MSAPATDRTGLRRLRSVCLHLAFFVSGAAALIYEVLWMRRFTVLLGATAPATAATLSALFLGIGLGSAIFGIVAARWKRPLVAFGLLEAGIAASALCVEPLLGAVEALLTPEAASPGRPAILLAVRMAMAMTAILPPAILMGGSLPVLAQAIDRGRLGLGVLGGGLYAVNAFGAAAGAIAVPTVLLPALGASGSLWAAMGASLSVAAISFLSVLLGAASRREGAATPGPTAAPASHGQPAPASSSRLLLTAAFFSGVVALGLEVLWTRMVALVHENSVYSFATVLAVFLTGIAAGAAVARAMLARGVRPRTIMGAGWIGAGVWVVATPTLFHALTSGLRYAAGSQGLLRHEMEIGGLALATMLPATLLAGTVLPALMEMLGVGHAGSASRALGMLLGANTLGAIVGPVVVLFLVGPALGLWWGLVLCGFLQIAAGEVALAGRSGRTKLIWRLSWYAAGVAVVMLWQPGDFPRVRVELDERLIDLREGPFGTVAVVDKGRDRRLMLNNCYVLGGTASIGEERLQAHIPLLLHPAPGKVAFLGLGTGITASAVLFHPVQEAVAMELVGEVVAAAREHFREANLRVFDDPRVRVAVEDARTGLRGSPGRFDVIVGDLVVPWRRGEAALYTLESFASARRALAPGGIFCQWVPLFQLSRREFDSIAATFLDVFPWSVLWKGDFRAGEAAVALIGLTSGAPLDPNAIDARARLYARHADPANPYLASPAGLWVYLAGPLSPGDPALRAAPRSRDDRPIVELESPAAQFSGGREGGSMFIREPLKVYLDALLARPLAGTPLERLDDLHLRWRLAGAEIWRASLLELQGRHAEADAIGLGGLSKLPEELRRALGVEVAPAP